MLVRRNKKSHDSSTASQVYTLSNFSDTMEKNTVEEKTT